MDQSVLDRANAWVNINYPELTGKERDQKLNETIEDIEAADEDYDFVSSRELLKLIVSY